MFKLHLDTIHDVITDWERHSFRLQLGASSLSKLHVLDLAGCYTTAPRMLAQHVHLKVLRMRDVDKDVALGASEWIYALHNLPKLEELRVNNAMGYHYEGFKELEP